MTGYPSLENTINTLKNGVVDFLIKPVNLDQMELCVRRVLRERRLFADNILLKKEIENKKRLEMLNKELLEKVTELNIMNKIMDDFSSISSTTLVFSLVVQMACEITISDDARFYVINTDLNRPIEVAEYHPETLTDDRMQEDRQILRTVENVVMEVVGDKIPLLVSENNMSQGLSPQILSFMAVPLKIRDKVFGVLTTSIKKGNSRFDDKNLYYLSFITQKAATAIENIALYENIYENLFSTLYAFVAAIEARDTYTNMHSNRVAELSMVIGKECGVSAEDLDVLNFAGRLHDIGKIGIRDEILLKPGRLTDEEFEVIKQHPVIGESIISKLGLWDREKVIIRYHHERYDGDGYPEKISGEDIPVLARIMTVADAYDAMASDRAYRKKMDSAKIRNIINECSGSQFDPNVVSAFNALFERGEIEKFY